MLSFLSPLFLIGSAAVAVPIVLHLLRREPEPRVRFAAVRLLRGAPVEYTDKRRLRELLLLALRAAALILLALAFARPFLASAAGASARATIVALDTSYSMAAPAAFARARRLAVEAIDRAPAGEMVGVVTFADTPSIAAGLGPDRAFARSAIEAAAPGFGATRYRGALGAAVQALGRRPGTIVVVTDLQESGWDAGDRASIPAGVRVEVADAGGARANLAVTALRTAGDRVIASVRNSGDDVRETRVRLTLDGRSAGEAPVAVAARATAEVEFDGAAGASTAIVTVDDRGGIAADDTRYAVLDNGSRPAVLVVTSNGDLGLDAFYVQQSLMAGSAGGRQYRVSAVTPAQLGAPGVPALAAHAAVVLLSSHGLERRGREALAAYVQGGGGLLIAAGPDVDGEVVAGVLGRDALLRIGQIVDPQPIERALVPIDVRHPVFQPFGAQLSTLSLVRLRRVARIDGGPCEAAARSTTGEAALLSCEAGAGRALVFASDLDNRWNDFPLRATFVPFVLESLRFLSGGRAEDAQLLVADVPPGVEAKPGFAAIPAAGSGAGSRRIAVNVDPRESDFSRVSAEDFHRAVSYLEGAGRLDARVQASGQEDRQHIWMYVLMVTIAVLAVESLVAGRTA